MTTTKKTQPQEPGWSDLGGDIVRAFKVPLVLVVVLCGIEVVNTVLLHRLNAFGVHPREPIGLVGLLFMPFLHGSFSHVIGNSITLMLFGTTMMLMRPRGDMLKVSIATGLGAGLFAWVVGSAGSVHVGYSGVLFGYFGYLLAIGFFERTIGSILLSLSFGAIYGVLIFGVLPGQPGISWEGHAGGFLTGVVLAFIMGRKARSGRSAERRS